jgi:hypothetical protein
MEKIKLKRTLRFYVGIVVLGVMVTSVSIGIENYFILACSTVFYFLGIYFTIKILRDTPIVSMDEYKIYFGKGQTYLLSDIVTMKLAGKVKNVESTLLTFKNGDTQSFPDDNYSNAWQLKQMLYKHFYLKDGKNIDDTYFPDSNTTVQHKVIFKDKLYKSVTGFVMLMSILFLLPIFFTKISTGGICAIICVSAFLFAVHAWQTNYVCLTKGYMEIKNHIFPQIDDQYRLCDIKEVVYEVQYRLPVALRIITKDFKSRYYFIPTLDDSTLKRLKRELKARGIVVRNECV